MKKLFFLLALTYVFGLTAIGQKYEMHDASRGVQYRNSDSEKFRDIPRKYAVLPQNGSFKLKKGQTVGISYNGEYYQYVCSGEYETIKVFEIVKRHRESIGKGIIKQITENSNKKRAGFTISQVGGHRMSEANQELLHASLIIEYLNSTNEQRCLLVDSSFILCRQIVSEDLFFFIVKNASKTDCYFQILQVHNDSVSVAIDLCFPNEEDGVVEGFLLFVPANDSLAVSDFTFVNKANTQYILIASEFAFNWEALIDAINNETIIVDDETMFSIGITEER